MKPISDNRPMAGGPAKAGVTLTSAIVSAGNVDTPYRRLGHGPPAVALGLWPDLDARAVPQELRVLAASCRIIVPDLDRVAATALPVGPPAASFTDWLGGFLDGLGLASASLIASWVLEEQLSGAVASLSGRIERIVIVGGAAVRSGVTPAAGAFPLPIRRAGSEPSWADIGRFLSGREP